MPRKTKPRRRGAIILWLDATGSDDDRKIQPAKALTYGEIVEMTEDHVTIASEVFDDADSRHHTNIPRGMVQKIIPFTFPDPFPSERAQ